MRILLVSVLAFLFCRPAAFAAEPDYPTRPITIVVGFAPGGFTDSLIRQFSMPLAQKLGQPIVISNKAGAGTLIATSEVARAKPDGYTLLLGTSSLSIYPSLQPDATPKHPMQAFVPIGKIHESSFVLLVNQDFPANTLEEFIAYAKQRPNEVNVGSSGVGAVNHLLLEMFNASAGVQLTHVPYKGGSAVMLDLQAKRLDATFATPLDALPYVKEGRGKILAVTSDSRLDTLPSVPALSESFPGFQGVFWTGLFAPAGTPQSVVDKLDTAVRDVAADPNIVENAGKLLVTVRAEGPGPMAEDLKRETATYRGIIKAADIRPN